MATVKQYVTQMRQAQKAIASKMGCDVSQADKQTRVAVLACDAMIAVLMRTLTQAGVITDAQLQAVLDAAMADLYDDEPAEPPLT